MCSTHGRWNFGTSTSNTHTSFINQKSFTRFFTQALHMHMTTHVSCRKDVMFEYFVHTIDRHPHWLNCDDPPAYEHVQSHHKHHHARILSLQDDKNACVVHELSKLIVHAVIQMHLSFVAHNKTHTHIVSFGAGSSYTTLQTESYNLITATSIYQIKFSCRQ